jgi:hypothetical protein
MKQKPGAELPNGFHVFFYLEKMWEFFLNPQDEKYDAEWLSCFQKISEKNKKLQSRDCSSI